jgi:HSP20 family protein
METKPTPAGKVVPIETKPVPVKDLFQEMLAWSNRVAKRAYELFQVRGFEHGHDLEDWFNAERELLKPVALEVKDMKDELMVHAEVPGFEAKDLEIELEGNCLVIKGKRETEKEEKEKGGKTIFTERKADEIYRMVTLPVPVLSEKAQAELRNGILELKLPKAAKPKAIKVTAA